jgi:lactose/L-arabinose transport system permease protein
MIVVMLALTWRWTGYNSVIMLAGLQNIPRDIYEAADIDGANTLTKFIKITIPQLKPVILFSVFNSINGTFQLFTEPNVLTQGGPANATTTMVLYLYKTAFTDLNFGVASAGSYILAIIIAALTLVQLRVMREDKV